MTYYRDYPHAHAHKNPPPLIDLIPDHREDVDVSDEEDGFYGKEDDFLIPQKWQNSITRATNRLPRRIKRYFVLLLGVGLLFLVSWWTYFGPQYAAHKRELKAMDTTPAMSYGSNVRPDFKGMIQVSDMDEQHLPKKQGRLVFVGDVHGCREELEHLLKKVDFNHKHDHLVLTGDMIAKGKPPNSTPPLLRKGMLTPLQAPIPPVSSDSSENSAPRASAVTGKTSSSSPSPKPVSPPSPTPAPTPTFTSTSSTKHPSPTAIKNYETSPRNSRTKN
jgi:hypothetical protein